MNNCNHFMMTLFYEINELKVSEIVILWLSKTFNRSLTTVTIILSQVLFQCLWYVRGPPLSLQQQTFWSGSVIWKEFTVNCILKNQKWMLIDSFQLTWNCTCGREGFCVFVLYVFPLTRAQYITAICSKPKIIFFMATCGFKAVYEWLLLLRHAVSVQSVYRPFSRVLKIVHT